MQTLTGPLSPQPSGDLFAPWFPDWVPGETLYGVCARYHHIAGGTLSSETCLRLFGHPRGGLTHDLTGRIATLAQRTRGLLGTPEQILLGHTVLGYYLHMREATLRERLIDELSHGAPAALKSRLGWLASGLGAAHPLKACEECGQSDALQGRCPTWYLVHQLPGVWLCPVHRRPLWVTYWKVNGLHRFEWLLPDDIPSDDRVYTKPPRTEGEVESAALVAAATATLVQRAAHGGLDPNAAANVLRGGLRALGLVTANDRLRADDLVNRFTDHLAMLRWLPEANAIGHSRVAIETVWRKLLSPGSRPLHPFRYVIAACWLFGGWLPSSLESVDDRREPRSLNPRGTPYDEHMHRQLLELIAGGTSPTAAARRLKIDPDTALLWATRAGVTVARRPKLITDAIRTAVISELRLGRPKAAISKKHGISEVSVTRVLLSVPGLREQRDRCISEARTTHARSRLLSIVAKAPGLSVKQVRAKLGKDYMWLYRHDRAWLQTESDKLPPGKRASRARVDWHDRDQWFAAAVKRAAIELRSNTVPGRSVRELDLVRAVPGLQAKIRHLPRLPLTKAEIGRAIDDLALQNEAN